MDIERQEVHNKMKPRRRNGATLGLIAVVVLVIIAIGVLCYFFAKIMGGGREVANATDAGTLAVAKDALRSTTAAVDIPSNGGYADFQYLNDPKHPNKITLYTYNRAVAQALLCCMNAAQENPSGTGTAISNADLVFQQLQTLGNDLRDTLKATSGTPYDHAGIFNAMSVRNTTRMYGNNATEVTNLYRTAMISPAGSTNIYFDPSSFPPNVVGPTQESSSPYSDSLKIFNLNVPDAYTKSPAYLAPGNNGTVMGNSTGVSVTAFPSGARGRYMAGYQPIGPIGGHTFCGVPVFPQQKPRMLSLADFNSSDPNVKFTPPAGVFEPPPNAFCCQSSCREQKSGNLGGAIACAIVGTVLDPTQNPITGQIDFAASFPGGYIEICNRQGYAASSVTVPVADPNNIFNNEIGGSGPQAYMVTPSGAGATPALTGGPATGWAAVGTKDLFARALGARPSVLDEMAAYNATYNPSSPIVPDLYNRDPAKRPAWFPYPPGTPSPSPTIYASSGGGAYGVATRDELLGILPSDLPNKSCYDYMMTDVRGWFPTAPTTRCFENNNVKSIANAYGRTLGLTSGAGSGVDQFSNVDKLKSRVVEVFSSTTGDAHSDPPTFCADTEAPLSTSGSGFGVYKDVPAGGGRGWPNAQSPPLEKSNGTAWQMLNQVASMAPTSCVANVMVPLTQRCAQIKPGVTAAEIQNLLDSTSLPIGTTLYIRLDDPKDLHSRLILASTKHNQTTGVATPNTTPDGPIATGTSGSVTCTTSPYDLVDGSSPSDHSFLDTQTTPGSSINGDAGLHIQPYQSADGQITATDHADFWLSSGYRNLLGKLDFYQTTSGCVNFSRPN